MNKKNLQINDALKKYLNIFSTEFDNYYLNIDKPIRSKFLSIAPAVFKKWYYSTLINDTFISPANLSGYFNPVNNKGLLGISLKVNKKCRGKSKYEYKFNFYSIEKHPIIDDLKMLTESCIPDAIFTENDYPNPELFDFLLSKLSVSDPLYLKYITVLAFHLDLLVKIPSINSNHVSVGKKYNVFFNKSCKENLNDIFHAVLKLCSLKLSEKTELYQLVSKESLLFYLRNYNDTFSIIQNIFNTLEIDIESTCYSYYENHEDNSYGELISSAMYLGMLLDKWFFSPLGSYLKIINPTYLYRFDFKEELNYLYYSFISKINFEEDIFSLCNSYNLTPIGEMLLFNNLNVLHETHNSIVFKELILDLNKQIKYDEYYKSLNKSKKNKNINIFKLKIKFYNDKRYWRTIEVEETSSLHILSEELYYIFDINPKIKYKFIFTEPNGGRTEYLSPNSKFMLDKSDKTKLSSLNLNKKDKFIFITESDLYSKYEIELLDISEYKPNIIYPRISAQSKLLTSNDDFETL